jgi:CubicO group peptidase (beta-lactamase class C family)
MHGTDDEHWRQRLIELARKYDVPGATLGILRLRPDGTEDMVEAAHGVLSRATKVAATTTSSFQIGSITKVYTAALIMQLIDEGRAEIDTRVAEVLPDLRIKGDGTADPVTIRHLLAHTSGIPGDLFEDTGRGDDCVEKYVASLNDYALEHPPGAIFSYSNGAYVVAGRVIEALTGQSWDEALRERLVEPLGLPSSAIQTCRYRWQT